MTKHELITRGKARRNESSETPKHTPGPWQTDCEICPATGTISIWHNGPIVYLKDNGDGPKNQKANARLIAAAPELLEALEAIMACNKELGAISRPIGNQARNAIAKAKGGV